MDEYDILANEICETLNLVLGDSKYIAETIREYQIKRKKEIKLRDCKALVYMAEPDKGQPHAYPTLIQDIDRWAELFDYTIIHRPGHE